MEETSRLGEAVFVIVIGVLIPLLITMVSLRTAKFFGYQFRSNYRLDPHTEMDELKSSIQADIRWWIYAVITSPISEEIIFRTAQTILSSISGRFVAAFITSVVFVALHETADVISILIRLVNSLIHCYLFHAKGIFATVAAHVLFNGLLFPGPYVMLLALSSTAFCLIFYVSHLVLPFCLPDAVLLAPKLLLVAAVLMLSFVFISPTIHTLVSVIVLLAMNSVDGFPTIL